MKWIQMSCGIAIVMPILAAVGIASAHAQERFDYEVREEMFRAFGGNEAALQSAMATIEAKLKGQPDHAEALVWRGAARNWMAGRALEAGDSAGARAMTAEGMADMDRALALEPSNIGVLVPRAAVLLAVARNQRDAARTRGAGGSAIGRQFRSALALRRERVPQSPPAQPRRISLRPAESWALAGNQGNRRTLSPAHPRRASRIRCTRNGRRQSSRTGTTGGRSNCQSCH